MTKAQQELKIALHGAIEKWAEENSDTLGWAQMKMYVHEDFESDMTEAAWAVFNAMSKSQIFAQDQNTTV